jgi:hypothetical protein
MGAGSCGRDARRPTPPEERHTRVPGATRIRPALRPGIPPWHALPPTTSSATSYYILDPRLPPTTSATYYYLGYVPPRNAPPCPSLLLPVSRCVTCPLRAPFSFSAPPASSQLVAHSPWDMHDEEGGVLSDATARPESAREAEEELSARHAVCSDQLVEIHHSPTQAL